ncbi:hypothetical protein EK21DRAFT_90047 [Setomelanomma holmii]|uniref:Uncharacterized protein n=1 Tax=Setomelanomma holmii TaxID=210430 RepID=A0A9P4H950_9PLEO|nr:hypothetical protein EK21DRAFT_90047 [Setomelanomma holmii]
MSSWFCCACGDGGHSSALVDDCPSCGHRHCSGCSVEDHGYSRPVQACNASPIVSDNTYHFHTAPSKASLSIATAAAAAPTSCFDTVTGLLKVRPSRPHGHDHGQPTDGPEYEAWTCCKCGYYNSVEYDAGCSHCHDHWKSDCCDVWTG